MYRRAAIAEKLTDLEIGQELTSSYRPRCIRNQCLQHLRFMCGPEKMTCTYELSKLCKVGPKGGKMFERIRKGMSLCGLCRECLVRA
jgi:hypothetical protein